MVGEPTRVVAPTDNERYRELARKLRGIACQSRLPATQRKILNLALRFAEEPITSTGEARRTISPKARAK
jgi:hypothetical protein